MPGFSTFPALSPGDAAAMIPHGATLGLSGFAGAGSPKLVPLALAERARQEHQEGRPFQVQVLTGASTGSTIDDVLGEAEALSYRAPYQSSKPVRQRANQGSLDYADLHLSHVARMMLMGIYTIDLAIIEATEVMADGKIYLTTSIGVSPTVLDCARRVIIEINRYASPRLHEMADILMLKLPPHRLPVPITSPMSRVGQQYVRVDPSKIVGIVETNEADHVAPFSPPDAISHQIADHVIEFFLEEMAAGRIPHEFLPVQSGVGNVANAVMAALGAHDDVPPFWMFTEVYQDSLVDLMLRRRLRGASTCALTLSPPVMRQLFDNMDFFVPRIVLRPQEISNLPALAGQLGLIAMNTALEVDIYGHVNSTHVCGTHVMNGIGGSGDFIRNGLYSIFMCPSVAKGGRISTIVPMCTHVDHSEHSVQFVVTEQGIADLRGLAPVTRARRLIDTCAHPAYRDYLHRYIDQCPSGHIRHDLGRCFELHQNLQRFGAMLPDLDFTQFAPDGPS